MQQLRERHPYIISLVWSTPYLIFLIYPISSSFALGLKSYAGLILFLLSIGLGLASIMSWIYNPVPNYSNRIAPKLAVSQLALVGIQLAMTVMQAHLNDTQAPQSFGGSPFLLCYAITAWIMQAPRPALKNGLLGYTTLTLAEIIALHDSPLALVICAGAGLVTGLARTGLEQQRLQELEHQRAITQAITRQREQFSADLHDILGHSLTEINLQAQVVEKLLTRGETTRAQDLLATMTKTSQHAMHEIRDIVAATRSTNLSEELASAQALLNSVDIACTVEQTGQLPAGIRSSLAGFAVREAVTNALRHARPTWVSFTVSSSELLIKNNGYNPTYSEQSAGNKSGLANLQARLQTEGSLDWGSDGDIWFVQVRFNSVDEPKDTTGSELKSSDAHA
ncbi:hypothetical protein KPC83_05650 [Collinsella sp. zg1085]|uniref:sensor histidine kinase n=1 Tax=Collinsella sp. zg1085 TaxID=2844380 RepID=UPI001C0DA95E|nr:histidine kinase [Collinsella sp. zg1085]QWT17327.1 hypothetical protein KPC83_05650 [Collinsella sp. zg1085]